ncbi:FkbM family methyltransferase, partial [Planktotalea sp.]|uniref:FkbM family methyltransferase n=1 Tax=Planktotalea sp. TaxID=2029877 RepID=UPI003298B2EF
SLRFAIDKLRGKDRQHRLSFGAINLKIRSQSPDLTVVRACLLGEFEAAMDHTDRNARFIVDAGGYIGLASILFARRFPKAQIVCLEPSSENYALARENCAPYPNITVLNKALGPQSGHATLRDRGTGQWGFTITPASDQGQSDIEAVAVISLPDLMTQFNASDVDLLKLDIEGAEYELFEASEEWIANCDVMIVELHEKIRTGVEALYKSAVQGRRTISRDAEKELSVRS